MYLKSLELSGFKSFAKKSELTFASAITAIVGPNGSGKSNVAEAFRFVLGEQSLKSMRTKRGEDLIWGGSHTQSRGNRASARVSFDNTSRLFDIDFDEVTIERIVHRDGVNQYLINGSSVRLKDVAELLASANIGSSGHHIISQGEADRLLSASIKERREMIEDALGLKIFQYKKKESEKKLEQTEENINQVMSLRKEIAPHLRFLKRQVEKIERSKQMREELTELLRDYLRREEFYITSKKADIAVRAAEPREKLARLNAELAEARATLEKVSEEDARGKEVLEVEQKLRETRKERDELARRVGRLEGQISYAEKHVQRTADSVVKLSAVKMLADDIEREVADAMTLDSLDRVKSGLEKVRSLVVSFFNTHKEQEGVEDGHGDIEALRKEKDELDGKLKEAETKEAELRETYKKLQEELDESREEGRDAERAVFRITTEKNTVEGTLRDLARDEEVLKQQEAEFNRDVEEGAVLGGRLVLGYADITLNEDAARAEARSSQEERKREVERLKIRVEEAGGGSSDEVLKEYQEASERDEFLEREVRDLETSSESLKRVIADLDEQLAVKFREGIVKINKEFQHFFELLFDGGSAKLTVLEQKKRVKNNMLLTGDLGEEEAEIEAGIDIGVSLPRKKVKGLQMLSGGERALTSIALLFAMSQVNPPPFLILDETEAALDEANSRKYGEMIKELAKKTQLILITHNRETMSVAGILYGITMGSDGISKLLSVKFDEAVQVAK
ncbi:MAG: AAA family ATPase [Candidatus Pacebacteria bacterium]|nr:AAA family ATPase [Candidatus Paceibacterota bacterium]